METCILFRIKLCGLKTRDDAIAAAAAGADAVGLNFYPRSKRFVDESAAATIAAALPHEVSKVGLFVNSDVEHIRHLHSRLGLHFIQLHGDETPEFVSRLRGLQVIKAFRLAPGEGRLVEEFIAACEIAETPLAGILIDAYDATAYGGTGLKADWPGAAALRAKLNHLPLILAGGLNAGNVAEAIAAVQPYGVDTASGVEAAGRKDPALMAQFTAAALTALKETI